MRHAVAAVSVGIVEQAGPAGPLLHGGRGGGGGPEPRHEFRRRVHRAAGHRRGGHLQRNPTGGDARVGQVRRAGAAGRPASRAGRSSKSGEVPAPDLEQPEAEEAPHAPDAALDRGGVRPVWFPVRHQAGARRRRDPGRAEPPDRAAQGLHHPVPARVLQGADGAHSRGGPGHASNRGSAAFTRTRRTSSRRCPSCRRSSWRCSPSSSSRRNRSRPGCKRAPAPSSAARPPSDSVGRSATRCRFSPPSGARPTAAGFGNSTSWASMTGEKRPPTPRSSSSGTITSTRRACGTKGRWAGTWCA